MSWFSLNSPLPLSMKSDITRGKNKKEEASVVASPSARDSDRDEDNEIVDAKAKPLETTYESPKKQRDEGKTNSDALSDYSALETIATDYYYNHGDDFSGAQRRSE